MALHTFSVSVLAGKVAVVLGGTGEVGEGITRALLAAGAIVAVVSRDNDKLSALHDRLPAEWDGQYAPIVGDLSTPEGAAAARERVEFVCRRLDIVVASLGGLVAEGADHLLEPRRLEPGSRHEPDAALPGGDDVRAGHQQA